MNSLDKLAKLVIDLEVGDVVLTGRYKNKRTVVKELGTDELGMPTMNGQKLLALRIEKLLPKKMWTSKTLAEEYNEKEAKQIKEQSAKISKVMKEFSEGTLKSGGSGDKVTNRKQAIAIAMSEAGLRKKKKKGMSKEARDEIVKLTYHKSSKKPYRQRSEVLAYDSETKEIVCRFKRSSVGGLYVELPGGGIDKGESPKTAVKREALEEAGITLKNIEQVGKCRWKWPKKHQEAMGSWADLYAGDDTYIFIAEVDTKGKPTSEEGDGWDRLQTRSIDKLRSFLDSHKKEGNMIMQDSRLAALKKLENSIANTYSQSTLNKVANEVNVNYNNMNKESNMHNSAAFLAGYMHKSTSSAQTSMEKQAREIAPGQASFLKALFPTMTVNHEGEDVKPLDIKHNWSRSTFKLPSASMATGNDTRNSYS